jgi:hypothetical protein
VAEDVKLSAYGRQPTFFLSFSFCSFLFFLTNTSPIVFHDIYFYYRVGIVLYFLGHAFLCQSLGEYFHPSFFFQPGIVSLSIH